MDKNQKDMKGDHKTADHSKQETVKAMQGNKSANGKMDEKMDGKMDNTSKKDDKKTSSVHSK